MNYEIDTLNWKDILNKNVEKVSSYRDLYIKKLKFINNEDELYDRILNRSLIYMVNKKGIKVDPELNNALNCSIKLINDEKKFPYIRNRFKNRIRSLYSNDNKSSFKYLTYLIYLLNKGEEIPDSLMNTLFSNKDKYEPKRGRTSNIVNLPTLSSTNPVSPNESLNKTNIYNQLYFEYTINNIIIRLIPK